MHNTHDNSALLPRKLLRQRTSILKVQGRIYEQVAGCDGSNSAGALVLTYRLSNSV